jgi:hypothetical protein
MGVLLIVVVVTPDHPELHIVLCGHSAFGSSLRRACETKLVTVWIDQVEEALSPFGITGCGGWVASGRERTRVKRIDVSDIEDHTPPPEPSPSSRLGNEVEIASPGAKAGERRILVPMQDLKP